MENVSKWIGSLPSFRQPRLYIQVLVAREQGIKNQLVNAGRLCVQPDSRIEIRGTAFNHHHQRVGIGRLGGGKHRTEEYGAGGHGKPAHARPTHKRFSLESPSAWPPSRKEYWTASGSMSGMPALQKRRLLWLLRGCQIRPINESRVPVRELHSPASLSGWDSSYLRRKPLVRRTYLSLKQPAVALRQWI